LENVFRLDQKSKPYKEESDMKKREAFRLTPIAAAVFALGTNASAQQAQAPAADSAASKGAATKETITVTGFKASLDSALNEKREDNGMIDVIKAEDIAKFPDTNLAEALQRVSGVVIDRDAGEGRNITVRGLGLDFTRVRINEIEALATTGGTDSSGGNNRSRGFDFNVFAADLFNTIIVRKSASADVDEGSLGATVDLKTSRPFDFTGFRASAMLEGRYNDLSGKTTPRGAFLVSNTWNNNTIGALISGAYSKRQLFEEGFSTVRWDNGPSSGGWCAPIGVTPANPSNSTATTCGPAAQGVQRIPRHAGGDPGIQRCLERQQLRPAAAALRTAHARPGPHRLHGRLPDPPAARDAGHGGHAVFEVEGHAPGGLPRGDLLQPHRRAGRQAANLGALHGL
jgi:hypothetical protein